MKNLIALLVICFTFLGIGSSFAEPLLLKVRTWEAGHEIFHFTYKEPGVMKEKGYMGGIAGSFAYHNKLMLKVGVRFSSGEVDYKNSGTMYDIDNSIYETRGLAGYDFRISKIAIVTPYIGLGYRYLNNDSSGMTSSTGARGYERESNYFYSPIGIETIIVFKKGWSIGGKLEYDYFWKGMQKSHLSDADPGINDIENDQHKGYGWRGSVKLQKKIKRVTFAIEPFIKYWDIKKSDNADITYYGTYVGYGYEPKNNSTEIGLKLSAKF